MNALLQSVLDGILMGGIYALAALGISLIFGVMKITNFAHGALITLGMYVTYELCLLSGLSPYIAMPLVAVLMFGVGYFIQRYLMHRIEDAPSQNQLLLTLGLSIIIQNLILVFWSADFKIVSVPGFAKAIQWGGITVNKPKLLAFAVVAVISVLLYWLLNRTDLGKAIRATSMQKDGATLMGIKIHQINAIAFGLGIACAGIAGALLTPIRYMSPTMGDSYQLRCFVIAVFGGLGNIWGAMAAGVIIGVVELLSALFLGGSWSEMVIYLIFVLTLMLRPTGLFGRKGS
jgi:branched-chain amino acid transport system permease protein